MEAPGFWDDPETSNKKMKELKNLKDTVDTMDGLRGQYEDIGTLIEMGYEEEDPEMAAEIRTELDSFIQTFESIRIRTLLSGEYDKNNAILKLNAGAGGTAATGVPCFTVCIPVGRNGRDTASKCWTIWTVTRQESSR